MSVIFTARPSSPPQTPRLHWWRRSPISDARSPGVRDAIHGNAPSPLVIESRRPWSWQSRPQRFRQRRSSSPARRHQHCAAGTGSILPAGVPIKTEMSSRAHGVAHPATAIAGDLRPELASPPGSLSSSAPLMWQSRPRDPAVHHAARRCSRRRRPCRSRPKSRDTKLPPPPRRDTLHLRLRPAAADVGPISEVAAMSSSGPARRCHQLRIHRKHQCSRPPSPPPAPVLPVPIKTTCHHPRRHGVSSYTPAPWRRRCSPVAPLTSPASPTIVTVTTRALLPFH